MDKLGGSRLSTWLRLGVAIYQTFVFFSFLGEFGFGLF